MVGEAGGARRQARRPRLRLGRAAAAALLVGWGCASTGDPPGGPPDTTPPSLLATTPESGAVLAAPPRRVELNFDEVIGERIAAQQPDISGAILVSPALTPPSVDWHRDRLTISLKGGFRPGRVYRVELLPVIVDLRQNRMKTGRTILFSTGPEIPAARLSGAIVDWTGGRPAPAALVEAVLLPDSLPYRTLADSSGSFTLAQVPPGEYLVYGVVDQNGNRRRDPREAFDTSRVTLSDSGSVELYAFAHDTVGPRLKSAEVVDSITARLLFDRPLDPTVAVDTSMVHVTPAADSTQPVPLVRVYTPAAYDSASKAEAAQRAKEQAARDSAARAQAAARDTTRRPAVPPAQPAPARALPPPLPAGPPGDTARGARRDSTHAMKMLARRPAPTDTRVVRFAAALAPGTRYVVVTDSVRGLTGVPGRGRTVIAVPVPRPTRAAADSLRRGAGADTSRVRGADTLPPRPPPAADTTRPAPRPDTLPARRDTAAAKPR